MNRQMPLNTSFNATTTAADVLKDRQLAGMTALITGGHSGLGLETTRALTQAGAQVIVAARNPVIARTRLAIAGISNIDIYELDLADLSNIRKFTQQLLATGVHLDMLICGAGIMACPETRIGPGWEAQFAINHLGHFALINRLFPLLADADDARVVVRARVDRRDAVHLGDLHLVHGRSGGDAAQRRDLCGALLLEDLVAALVVVDVLVVVVVVALVVLGESEARDGQVVIDRHFPGGSGSPAYVLARESDRQEVAEAIEDLLQRKPHLAAQGGSTSFDSGRGKPRPKKKLTRDDLKRMSPDEIVKARREGRIET